MSLGLLSRVPTHPPGSVLVNYSGTSSVPRLLHVIALHLPATLYLRLYYLSRLGLRSYLTGHSYFYTGISYVAADGGGARLSHWIVRSREVWMTIQSLEKERKYRLSGPVGMD